MTYRPSNVLSNIFILHIWWIGTQSLLSYHANELILHELCTYRQNFLGHNFLFTCSINLKFCAVTVGAKLQNDWTTKIDVMNSFDSAVGTSSSYLVKSLQPIKDRLPIDLIYVYIRVFFNNLQRLGQGEILGMKPQTITREKAFEHVVWKIVSILSRPRRVIKLEQNKGSIESLPSGNRSCSHPPAPAGSGRSVSSWGRVWAAG